MKKIYTSMAMIAVLMSMLCLCACDKKDNMPDVEDVTVLAMNDVAYVRSRLVAYNAQGQYLGFVMGSNVYPDMPTALYVGVDGMDEALMYAESLIPMGATVKGQTDRKVVTLTDEKGNAQGEMYIRQNVDDMILAEVSFSKDELIDDHVSVVRFIPARLWPDNEQHNGPMKLGQIWRHKRTGNKYVCMKEPEAGRSGLLFRICDFTFVYVNDIDLAVRYFPLRVNLSSVASTLRANPALWDVLAKLHEIEVEWLKKQVFFEYKTNNKVLYAFPLNGTNDVWRNCTSTMNVNISILSDTYVALEARIYTVSIGDDGYVLTLDCGFTEKPENLRPYMDTDIFNDLTLTDKDFELVI